MLGAFIGDIVGSRFEFDNHRSKEFSLFGGDGLRREECFFTDDTVMTAAVADALMACGRPLEKERFQNELILKMHEYGALYPDAGYGGMFGRWLIENLKTPYNSFGNGSAMRAAPCGWFGETLEECLEAAEWSSAVTHNHPEGIKGAQAVAEAIYLARKGAGREEIRARIEERYYPRAFEKSIDEIRPTYRFNETCMETVPQALEAFYESTGFEDAIRLAISVGGDSDTLACITGGVAEAFYGIPEKIEKEALAFLDERMKKVLFDFRAFAAK